MKLLGIHINTASEGLWIGRSSLTNVTQWFKEAVMGPESSSGEFVTVETSKQLGVVYACNRLIANTIAQVPINYYTETQGGKELNKSDKLFRLISKEPSEVMSSYTFRYVMQSLCNLYGEAFSIIERDGNGQPKNFSLPVSPDLVEMKMTKSGNIFWDVKENDYMKERNNIPDRDMFHLMSSSENGLRGKSIIKEAMDLFGEGIATQKFTNRFYKNGAAPSMLVKSAQRLNPTARENLKNSIGQFKGSGQGGVLILEEGTDLGNIAIPQREAQFLESRKFTKEEISSIFGVPLPLINALEHSNYSNIESLRKEFIISTIQPIAVNWEMELDRKLKPKTELGEKKFFKYNFRRLMRGDLAKMGEYWKTMKQIGVLTSNEIREDDDRNRSDQEGADELYKQKQDVPLSFISEKKIQNGIPK